MSEVIEETGQEEPLEYRCGQCDAYYFNDPGSRCPCCGGDSMYEVWPDEEDFNEWPGHNDPKRPNLCSDSECSPVGCGNLICRKGFEEPETEQGPDLR